MNVALSDNDVERIALRTVELLESRGLGLAASAREPKFLSMDDIKRRTGYSVWKISKLIDAGKFPKPCMGGGKGAKQAWRLCDIERVVGS